MPPSITENPEAFFEELNKPQKEEPAVEVSPVTSSAAPIAANPLTGNLAPEKEAPKAEQASITDDPEAFFSGLIKPAQAKEETPQDLVLSQLAGKTGEQMDDFDMQSLNLLSPKELEEVTNQRRDIPLSENLLRTKFDYEMSLPWNEGINKLEDWKKIGQEVFGGGVSFLKGAQKFAEQSLFADAEQDPSGWGHPSFKPVKDYVSGIASLPESAAYLFTKLKEGGMGLADRLSESIGVQDREKSYENYKARNLVDRIQAQETQENPSIYSRILKGDMANDALAYVVLNTLPDRETLMAQEGLTAEQADSKRKEIANAIARKTTSDIASREKPADEDIATFATFTAPAGLALGEMGLVSLGLEAGMGLTPKIAQGIKYLGKTDQEIKAMNDAAQALQKEQALQGLEKAQKPSMLGRATGALATGIENTEAAFAKIGEATPNILKELAPPAIGAVVAGDERRGEGAIVGALLGKAGKPALAALKYASKTPALIRDIEEARVLAAGGSKGTFETLASFPEVSENTAKILRFGGRRLDNTLNNVVEYAKAGVNPTLIALATGALDSASPEELNKLTSTGLLYGLGGRVVHQAWGKITGIDPVIDARNRRQQDIDDLKTYRDLDPETRKTLDSVTSWDNIVDLHTQRAANAEKAYNDAVARGKNDAEQLGKVAQAEKNILSSVTRANVQTRDEFSRQFVTQLTKLNQLVNGTLRAGQNNVGINILTPDQIIAKFRSDPANATATDQEILDVASQRGFYSTPEGSVEYQAGMGMDAPKKKIVFDRTKPSVVINADALKARMMIEGSTPIDALNHEVGHHVRNIPEFREANKDAEDLLFSQEVKDPAGNVVAVTAGQYSGKDLVDMYLKSYLKGKTPDQITQLSQLAGLWDYSRGALNESAVAEYMKDEIIAELNSETFSTHLGKGLDNSVLHMLDVARLKTKKNLLDRAVQKFFGLGGKGEATSDLTGARFSPDVLAANRQAMRALQSLQGEVSQAVTSVDSPKISRSEMLKNKAIRERYGKYAGLFKTKMQGQVFDGNGNPIGSPIDITNPSASEGSWESRNGETKQLNGYGARPDEVAESAGVVIPDGGRLVVQKQIVTQPDGVTPVMMTPKEAKDLQKNRAEVIRQSLNTPDEGAPNRFEAVNDDSETWRGTFTPLQIQAIKDMPEGIIPKSIKEHMLKINDMIVKGDGGRMLVDYAAVMNDAGKYTAYSPKIYDVVPIGMHLSKGGNFLVTTVSVGRMFDKINAWSERMPARLAPWGGSKDAFFKEFTEKYLQNWQNGLAGETGLSGNNAEALAKKDIFNDFLNLTTNDFRGANMDRTTTPRRRGDARGKNVDRTIMSMRLDHMAELMDNENAPKVPIDYGKAIKNFMPAEETAPAQEERRQTPFDGITATYKPAAHNSGISFRPSTPTEEYPTSERGFYSGLQKTIDEKMPAKASPQQILSIVNNPQNAKADEVKWSNLAGFVEGKTSVTKQEVLDYLRNEGSVKFEEVNLGGENTANTESPYWKYFPEVQRVFNDSRNKQDFIINIQNDNKGYSELNRKGYSDLLEEDDWAQKVAESIFADESKTTKFDQEGLRLSGGENYREVVLTIPKTMESLPEVEARMIQENGWEKPLSNEQEIEVVRNWKQHTKESTDYTSSHFSDIPNYVAHMRLDERPDAEGRDGLFIEEIQSDRHQQGREKGYQDPEQLTKMQELGNKQKALSDKLIELRKRWEAGTLSDKELQEREELKRQDISLSKEISELNQQGGIAGIPDAPFRKDWPVQMFKRALRDAIEGDKEWIGWTKGIDQVKRYENSIRQAVDEINYDKNADGSTLINATKGGKSVFSGRVNADGTFQDHPEATGKTLDEIIGKGMADKINSSTDAQGILKGDDLTIGGEGMKGFYDQILPKEIGKYVKKWGAKVEESDLEQSLSKEDMDMGEIDNATPEELAQLESDGMVSGPSAKIWKINITPEMRTSIKEGGQIAFMPKSEAREEERTERLPASGAELTASLVASGTSLESFGKDTLAQLAEFYGVEVPKGAKRGEIIDAINERPIQAPVAAQPQETKFSFTTSTKRDDAIKRLIDAGDDQGIRDLNRTTILSALADLKNIQVAIEDAKGVYKGDKEVSSIIKVTTNNQQDLNRVRSRIADAAKMFQQMEFLEEKMGAGKRSLFGETDEDGFKHMGSSTLYVEGVTEDQIEQARKQAGIDGLTLADGRIELYDRSDDPEFFNRVTALDTAIRQAGGVVTSSETGVASVKSYSEDPQRYAGTIGYDDESLHLYSRSGEQERLRSPLVQKLMGLMGRPMEAPESGKRSYFEAKDVTPEQVKKQAGIAQRFADLPLNDLANPLVKKSYDRLNAEILKQYDYLTAGNDGTKFTSQSFDVDGEPYRNSGEAIDDIRTKNSLKFLKTDPNTFGPEGQDFSYHPLLQDSGRTDANGVRLVYNDLFRAVHDAIAHGLFGAEFGPVGEESAWQTHMRTIEDPWARWALTTETRGQNSFVNYRDQMIGKDGMPLRKGDEGYIPLDQRGFAEQKAALLPLEDSLTGDKKVDDVTRGLMKEIGEEQSQGSAGGISFMPAEKIDSAEFKDWFGNYEEAKKKEYGVWGDPNVSKVVDSNGNPLVVYHGSDKSGFTIFGKPSKGFQKVEGAYYFAENKDTARSYAKGTSKEAKLDEVDPESAYYDSRAGLYPVYLDLKNPYEYNMEGANWDGTRYKQYQVVDGNGDIIYTPEGRQHLSKEEAEKLAEENSFEDAEVEESPDEWESTDTIVKRAMDEGYDGVIIRDVVDQGQAEVGSSYEPTTIYVAFDPTQIKSATQNVGTYSKTNPDIRFMPYSPELPKTEDGKVDWAGFKTRTMEIAKPLADLSPIGGVSFMLQEKENKSLGLSLLKGEQQPEGLPKTPTIFEIANWFQDRFKKPIDYRKATQQDAARLAIYLISEIKHAYNIHPEAAGWYDENIRLAMDVMRELDPDLAKKENEFVLKALIAVTSDGNAVDNQFTQAWDEYQHWKKTGEFSGNYVSGTRIPNIKNNIKAIGHIVDKLGTDAAIKWLTTKGTVSDLKKSVVNDLGWTKEEAAGIASGELENSIVPYAAVFGPKLGSFFNNLYGDFSTTTMDRWFMRTIGRLTGKQIKDISREKLNESRQRVRDAISSLSVEEKKKLGISKASFEGTKADDSSKKMSNYFSLKENREGVSKQMDAFRKAVNNHNRTTEPLVESPQNGNHRKWIRSVIDEVQKQLKSQGINLENADLQALLWYGEKELYEKLGYRSRERSDDYASAAAAVYEKHAGKPSGIYATSTGRVGRVGRTKGSLELDK